MNGVVSFQSCFCIKAVMMCSYKRETFLFPIYHAALLCTNSWRENLLILNDCLSLIILLLSQWCHPWHPPRPMACRWGVWHLIHLPAPAATAVASHPSADAVSLKHAALTWHHPTLLYHPLCPQTCPFAGAARLLHPTASTNETTLGGRHHCPTVCQCHPVPKTPAWVPNPSWTAHRGLIPSRGTGPHPERFHSCSVAMVTKWTIFLPSSTVKLL